MKFKDWLLLILGVSLVLFGFRFLYEYKLENEQIINEYKVAVQSSTITVERYISPTPSISIDEAVSGIIDFNESIEALDSDQEVEIVETYCRVISVPQYDITAYIGKDTSKKSLKKGVGHHPNTAGLGEIGNCVIAGHSSVTYDCIFNGIEAIELYDTFFIYDDDGIKHTYYVVDKRVVSPYDTYILYLDSEGTSQATLYTCTNKGTQRLVIVGREFTEEQLNEYKLTLKERLYNSMFMINDSIKVEEISTQVYSRGSFDESYYSYAKTPLLRSEVSIWMELNPINEFVNSNEKAEVFDYDFNMTVGIFFRKEEVLSDDISES